MRQSVGVLPSTMKIKCYQSFVYGDCNLVYLVFFAKLIKIPSNAPIPTPNMQKAKTRVYSSNYSETSSSFPGYIISCRITASTWLTKTNNHMEITQIDNADPTPLIAALSNELPKVMVAIVNPVFGKTIAHQLRWNAVGGDRRTAINAMQKNHRLRAQRKAPAARAKISIIRPSATVSSLPITLKVSGRPRAMPMSAKAVKAGGPTQMNIPGLCSRFGRPDSISRPM